MSKITYADKVPLYENTDIADINKVKADDMNEIKNVVNANDDDINALKTNLNKIPTINTSAQVNSSYIDTINVNNVIKNGKIVQFIFRGHVSQNIQNNTIIMTLPYPPLIGSNNFFIQAKGSQYDAKTLLWGFITGEGDLHTNYIESGSWIHINITYITND